MNFPTTTRPRRGLATQIARTCAAFVVALFVVIAVAGGGSAAALITPTPDPDPVDIDTPIPPAVPDVDDPTAPPIGSPDLSGPSTPTFDTPTLPDLRPGGLDGDPDTDDSNRATLSLDVPDVTGDSSNAVVIILLLSVLSVAPSLLIMMTSYTRIVIVMSMTRSAMGIPQLPPQQVIVGLSLFLTLFVMGPTLTEMNDLGLQPLLNGELSFTEAAEAATGPLREFMLTYTRDGELELFLDASGTETPIARDDVPLTALIPAFVLSELKSAFILGFIIFVPFVVIDLVVSAVLTSLGMMMLPPTFVSLPLKLLLFILLDGWTLIVGTLLQSYQ